MCILINYIVYCNLDSCVWSKLFYVWFKLFYLNSLLHLYSFFFNYCLSVYLCLSIYLFVCLSVCLSVYLSLSLSVCLSVCLCLFQRLSSPFLHFMQLGTQSYYFLVSIYLNLSYLILFFPSFHPHFFYFFLFFLLYYLSFLLIPSSPNLFFYMIHVQYFRRFKMFYSITYKGHFVAWRDDCSHSYVRSCLFEVRWFPLYSHFDEIR